MNVFVTGATGWIGSAVVRDLLDNGHSVMGQTTTTGGADRLKGLGVEPIVGRLDQHDLLRAAAARSDGVIHTAFIHGPEYLSNLQKLQMVLGALNGGMVASFMRQAAATEQGAVAALGSGLAGSDRPLVVSSGLLMLPHDRLSVETDTHVGLAQRRPSERSAFAFVDKGVRACAVRLAPTVHGAGDKGFMPRVIDAAKKHGRSPYIGDGSNQWPSVHRLDAARLFRLVLEQGRTGAAYHGAAVAGTPFKDIAALIGEMLACPVVSLPQDKAAAHFGFLGALVGLNNPASSDWTRQSVGWSPTQPSLLDDMRDHYF